MGVRFPSVSTSALLNANVGINTETIIVTTPPLILPLDFAQVILLVAMAHTIGATAASSTYQIRRGTTLGGLSLGPITITGTAGSSVLFSDVGADIPGAVTGQQYTLTCLDPGSTAVGAVSFANFIAFVL